MRNVSLACLLAAMLFLGACHTMQGIGEDLESAGRGLSNAASRHSN